MNLSVRVQSPLRDFTLDVELETSCRKVTLVGETGSGKTSLLRIIAGLVSPQSGRIALNGRVLLDTAKRTNVPADLRRVGMVFQEPALFPHLTVAQNIDFGVQHGREEVRHLIDMLSLHPLLHERPARLSGGERQKAALARSLAARPEMLLLDEPMSALDIRARTRLRRDLRQTLEEVRIPYILVTHDPLDALAFGDVVGVMERGAIAQFGPKDVLLRSPKTQLVAQLGGLNLFRATVRESEGQHLALAEAGALTFAVPGDTGAGERYLAFEPSAVSLSLDVESHSSPQNRFSATVVEMATFGSRLRCALDAGEEVIAEISHDAATSLGLEKGMTVMCEIKATAIRVYE